MSIGYIKQTNTKIVQVLKQDSEVLARIQDSFHTMILSRTRDTTRTIQITCFYEELPLPGVGFVGREYQKGALQYANTRRSCLNIRRFSQATFRSESVQTTRTWSDSTIATTPGSLQFVGNCDSGSRICDLCPKARGLLRRRTPATGN